VDKIYFCPRCHRRVEPPAFLKQPNLKVKGAINLQCGYCKKGRVVIKPKAVNEETLPSQPEQSA
jgi:uncharacterized CHY-type Zn-finger protein